MSPRGDRLALVADQPAPLRAECRQHHARAEAVGYPPTALRWSGDSRELFFEWRQPGEDEPATWAVRAAGGEPRRLTDEERRSAPGPDCAWDEAQRRRCSPTSRDIVLVDTVARTRRQVTRTTAAESDPRFTRGETQSRSCATTTSSWCRSTGRAT